MSLTHKDQVNSSRGAYRRKLPDLSASDNRSSWPAGGSDNRGARGWRRKRKSPGLISVGAHAEIGANAVVIQGVPEKSVTVEVPDQKLAKFLIDYGHRLEVPRRCRVTRASRKPLIA